MFADVQDSSSTNDDRITDQSCDDQDSIVKDAVGMSTRSEQLERIEAMSVIFLVFFTLLCHLHQYKFLTLEYLCNLYSM